MQYGKRKLLSIVTETSIEPLIVRDIKKLGAHGYTSWDARGEGGRGARSADWGRQSRNVMIKVICEQETADRIAQHLVDTYYDNYAMILYITDVDVIRPEKF